MVYCLAKAFLLAFEGDDEKPYARGDLVLSDTSTLITFSLPSSECALWSVMSKSKGEGAEESIVPCRTAILMSFTPKSDPLTEGIGGVVKETFLARYSRTPETAPVLRTEIW